MWAMRMCVLDTYIYPRCESCIIGWEKLDGIHTGVILDSACI